ncbi:hypothetical protein GCM10017607_11320 [Microbacterium thalassium]|nr:hypothetical protein GCM10017607_11320 [Microbacterium thalassium]
MSLAFIQAWVPDERFYFGGNPVEWSLSVEAFMYALFPFLVPLVRRLTISGLIALATVTASTGIVYSVAMQFTATNLEWTTYIFPIPRLTEFVLGVCAAVAVRRGVPRIPLWAATLGAISAWQGAAWLPGTIGWGPAVAVPFVVLIVAAAQADIAQESSVFRNRWIVRLGEWSFAFYLIHQMVIRTLAATFGLQTNWSGAIAMALGAAAAAVTLSAALYHSVELPLERWIRRTRLPRLDAVLVRGRRSSGRG